MGKYSVKPHYPLPPAYRDYLGGKGGEGVYQTIINQMPPHVYYVEPFCGSAQIFRRKALAQLSFLGDLDGDLILAHAYAIAEVHTDAEQQRRQVLASVEFAGANGLSHHAFLPNVPHPNMTTRIASVSLNVRDYRTLASEVIAHIDKLSTSVSGKQPTVCWYLDPPYPDGTRVSANSVYKHEMGDREQRSFLAWAKKLPGYVLISTYPNPLYERELTGWRKVEFTARTRGGSATEWLFCNFPEPTELHDYQYLGDDYRIREAMKGRLKTLSAQLATLPTLQRNALLAGLGFAAKSMQHVPMPVSKSKSTTLSANPDSIPAEQPVAAAVVIPAAPLGDGYVYVHNICQVCGKRNTTTRNSAVRSFNPTDWGWTLRPDHSYENRRYTCSMRCTLQAGDEILPDELPVVATPDTDSRISDTKAVSLFDGPPPPGQVWVVLRCRHCQNEKTAMYPAVTSALRARGFEKLDSERGLWFDPDYSCTLCLLDYAPLNDQL